MITNHQPRYGRLVLSRKVGQVVDLHTLDRTITLRVMSVEPLRLSIAGAKVNTAIGAFDSRLAWNTISEIYTVEGMITVEARTKCPPEWAKLCITAPRGVRIRLPELANVRSHQRKEAS